MEPLIALKNADVTANYGLLALRRAQSKERPQGVQDRNGHVTTEKNPQARARPCHRQQELVHHSKTSTPDPTDRGDETESERVAKAGSLRSGPGQTTQRNTLTDVATHRWEMKVELLRGA